MSKDNLDHLITSFRSNPNRSFTPVEVRTLERAAEQSIWAAKAAALNRFKQGSLEPALALMQTIWRREPTGESLKNIAVCLRSLRRYAEAIEWLSRHGQVMDQIQYHDLLCSLYRLSGNIEEAVRQGDTTLQLKDASCPEVDSRSFTIRSFDPNSRKRNIISFSLWGNDPRYLQGAITNSIVCRYVYPGWTVRFYINNSLPPSVSQSLLANGAQLVAVSGLPAEKFGLFWRFLVEDDKDVDIYLVRDADSVVNIREAWAVTDWLRSKAAFHVMRDRASHSELMLAGMWGAHRGNIGRMRDRIAEHVQNADRIGNDLTTDQRFLRTRIWPIVRQSVMTHDSFFNFGNPRRYPAEVALPGNMHIGQNDWVNRVKP